MFMLNVCCRLLRTSLYSSSLYVGSWNHDHEHCQTQSREKESSRGSQNSNSMLWPLLTHNLLTTDWPCRGERNFPLPFQVLLAGLRIKVDMRQIKSRKSNKSLITCIHGRDPGKLSNTPKWLKSSP